MKFSSVALAAVFLASGAEAFAGPQMRPRFGVQVSENGAFSLKQVERKPWFGVLSLCLIVVSPLFRLPQRLLPISPSTSVL